MIMLRVRSFNPKMKLHFMCLQFQKMCCQLFVTLDSTSKKSVRDRVAGLHIIANVKTCYSILYAFFLRRNQNLQGTMASRSCLPMMIPPLLMLLCVSRWSATAKAAEEENERFNILSNWIQTNGGCVDNQLQLTTNHDIGV